VPEGRQPIGPPASGSGNSSEDADPHRRHAGEAGRRQIDHARNHRPQRAPPNRAPPNRAPPNRAPPNRALLNRAPPKRALLNRAPPKRALLKRALLNRTSLNCPPSPSGIHGMFSDRQCRRPRFLRTFVRGIDSHDLPVGKCPASSGRAALVIVTGSGHGSREAPVGG
jgi:hypothetical protein